MPTTHIEHEFSTKEIVYLRTDGDQCPRLITAIIIYDDGSVCYQLICGTVTSTHFGYELSREKNLSLTT